MKKLFKFSNKKKYSYRDYMFLSKLYLRKRAKRYAFYCWKQNIISKRAYTRKHLRHNRKLCLWRITKFKNKGVDLSKKVINNNILNKKIKNKNKFYSSVKLLNKKFAYNKGVLINKKSNLNKSLYYNIYRKKYLIIFSPRAIEKRRKQSRIAESKITDKFFERYNEYRYYAGNESLRYSLPPHLYNHKINMQKRVANYHYYFKANKPFQPNKNMDTVFMMDFIRLFVGSYTRQGNRRRVCKIIKMVLSTLKKRSKLSFIKILKIITVPLRLIIIRKLYRRRNQKYLQPLLPKRAVEEAKFINLYLKKKIMWQKRWAGASFYFRILNKFKSLIEIRNIHNSKKWKNTFHFNYRGGKYNYRLKRNNYRLKRNNYRLKRNNYRLKRNNFRKIDLEKIVYINRPEWISKLKIEKRAGGIKIPRLDLEAIKLIHGKFRNRTKSPRVKIVEYNKGRKLIKKQFNFNNIIKNSELKKIFKNDLTLINRKKINKGAERGAIISRYYNRLPIKSNLK